MISVSLLLNEHHCVDEPWWYLAEIESFSRRRLRQPTRLDPRPRSVVPQDHTDPSKEQGHCRNHPHHGQPTTTLRSWRMCWTGVIPNQSLVPCCCDPIDRDSQGTRSGEQQYGNAAKFPNFTIQRFSTKRIFDVVIVPAILNVIEKILRRLYDSGMCGYGHHESIPQAKIAMSPSVEGYIQSRRTTKGKLDVKKESKLEMFNCTSMSA